MSARTLSPSALVAESSEKIWLDIEKRVLGEAYMIKVMDFADIRAYNTKYENLKPYYFTRFWDVWLK